MGSHCQNPLEGVLAGLYSTNAQDWNQNKRLELLLPSPGAVLQLVGRQLDL
jgi:hypothetical protein